MKEKTKVNLAAIRGFSFRSSEPKALLKYHGICGMIWADTNLYLFAFCILLWYVLKTGPPMYMHPHTHTYATQCDDFGLCNLHKSHYYISITRQSLQTYNIARNTKYPVKNTGSPQLQQFV